MKLGGKPWKDLVFSRGKGICEEVGEGKGGYMMIEGAMTRDSEHTTQYLEDVLPNYTPEVYIVLLINVILINFLKK